MILHLFSYLHFLSATLFFLLACVTIYQESKALINRVCALFLLSFAVWSSGQVFIHSPEITYQGARLAENISSLGWINFSGIFLIFCLVFTENRKHIKFALPPIVAIQTLLIVAQWNDMVHLNTTLIKFGWVGHIMNPIGNIFVIYYTVIVLIGLLYLYHFRKKTDDLMKKRQASIFLTSAIIALVLSTITNIILPKISYYAFPPIGDVITLFWATGVVYATIKYRFLSISPTVAVDSIVESMADCLILLTPDLKVAFINKAAASTLNLEKDNISGLNFNTLLSSQDLSLVNKIKNFETITNFHTYIRINEGQSIPVSLSCTPIHGAGFACILRDATSQIKAQELLETTVKVRTQELQRSNEELLRHIEELNTTKAQLNQAQKLESVGQLAGGVAHDFNNMLAVVSGFSEMIKKIDNSDKTRIDAYANRIIEITTRSAQLVSRLLDFARKGRSEMAKLSFHGLLNSTYDLLRHTISSNITITIINSAESDTIIGDSSQLQNAILNMAINARDAMPNGGTLTLSTSMTKIDKTTSGEADTLLDTGDYIKLTIADTGYGMDNETMKKIFEPFFTTKEVGKGTGLGLASVYGIVKQHKGHIEVRSEKGIGTSFDIYIPLQHTFVQNAGTEIAESTSKTSPKLKTILLADDNVDLQETMSFHLVSEGYKVILTNNGMEALRIFEEKQDKIDLLIFDMVMPVMGGKECCKRIKKYNPDIPVILTSGYTVQTDLKDFANDETVVFLQKPVSLGTLISTLNKLFSATPQLNR